MSQQLDLDDREQRVLDAVADLEAQGARTFVQEIGQRAGLDLDDVHEALRRLIGEHNLVSEVTGDPPEMGPQYVLRQPEQH